jgi:hypothetical protein
MAGFTPTQGLVPLIYEVTLDVAAGPAFALTTGKHTVVSLWPREWLDREALVARASPDCPCESAWLIPLGIQGAASRFELVTSSSASAPGHVVDPLDPQDRDFFFQIPAPGLRVGSPFGARADVAGQTIIKMMALYLPRC